jgi:hypothetical protein
MKFLNLYNLILEELTDTQKKLTDKYTAKRDQNLSFGPIFKEERTYFPLNITEITNIEIPNEIIQTLDDAGFYITDYRAGIAMKKAKPGEQKDLRQIKIGKILGRLNKSELLKQFNERLGTSKKDIKGLEVEICITHNPYDIAGMSTDRNWTSCMELDNGEYKTTPLKQVQYGGMCAYLIFADDKNIEKPLARIAIKRFISKNDLSKFIFAAEDRIYGDEGLANEIGFQEELIKILEQSNKLTANIGGEYIRKDKNSYSDTYDKNYYWFNSDNLNKQNKDTLLKYIESSILKYKPISCKVLKYVIKTYPEDISYAFKHLDFFYVRSLKCYDIDKELIELLLKNNIITLSFKYAKDLTTKEALNLIIKYSNTLKDSYRLIFAFLENKNIKFTQDHLDKILNILINNNFLPIDIIRKLFTKYKLSDELLHKYLSLIIEKDKLILEQEDFLLSQDFPADIMIKYCDEELLTVLYYDNNHLSKENKEKLKQYLNKN